MKKKRNQNSLMDTKELSDRLMVVKKKVELRNYDQDLAADLDDLLRNVTPKNASPVRKPKLIPTRNSITPTYASVNKGFNFDISPWETTGTTTPASILCRPMTPTSCHRAEPTTPTSASKSIRGRSKNISLNDIGGLFKRRLQELSEEPPLSPEKKLSKGGLNDFMTRNYVKAVDKIKASKDWRPPSPPPDKECTFKPEINNVTS